MKVAGLQLFGPAHLWTLTLIAIVGSIIVLTVRLAGNPAVARSVAFSLAALLVVNAAITYGTRLATDRFDVSTWLPMHLCDWATIAVVLALCFRWQWSYELAYFWSLGGTLQALLTPDIVTDFPTIWFLDTLAKIVGSKPLPRSEVTKKVWDYIKKNKLQDAKKKTLINADDVLKAVFGGKKQVTMFEMTKHISGHLK
jgi:SWIB/MDM2 domain/TMEM164 family